MTDPSVCACCGNRRTRRRNGCWKGAHNWCHTCYERWRLAGKPASGVPSRLPGNGVAERIAHMRITVRAAQLDRLTDYAWLISFGETHEQAAAQVGISQQWAHRTYDRMLADQEAARGEVA